MKNFHENKNIWIRIKIFNDYKDIWDRIKIYQRVLKHLNSIKKLIKRAILQSYSSSAIPRSESLTKKVSSDCKTSAILFSRYSCCQSTCVGSTAGSDVIASA